MRGADKQQLAAQDKRRTLPGKLTTGFALVTGLAAVLCTTGCGNQYRPVVSAISPVGPAGQPTKYAVAISNPSGTPALATITGYSIATVTSGTPPVTNNVATFTAVNSFNAGEVVNLSGFGTSTFWNGQSVTVISTGLSSTQFEAVVTFAPVAATTEAGLATLPGTLLDGLLTIVDVSGDTVLSTPSLQGLTLPAPTTTGTTTVAPTPTFINPTTFTLNSSGSEGFFLNNLGVFEDFGLSNPTGLRTQDIVQNTLAANAVPYSVQTYSLASTGTTIFVPTPTSSSVSELSLASGVSLLQNLSVAPNPVYVVGTDSAQRVYAISQGNGVSNGTATSIENSPITTGTPIPVGINPTYGVMTTDGNRAFILNKGNAANTAAALGTSSVSVINVPSNGLDTAVSTIAIPDIAIPGGTTVPAHPVWADLDTINSEFVVLNQGDGVHPGTLTLISIPLCNVNTPVTNPNCLPANPVDAVGFGTIVGTIPVGINPTMVSVLVDGSRAYVVNSGILPGVNSAYPNGIEGSVSVVNLLSNVVTATIPATSLPANTVNTETTPSEIYGHPNTVSATTGNPTGKVYVTSSDNKYMTIIETDTDSVDTHISLQGLGVRVIVTAK